jgi:hypothetical protein
MRNLRRTRKRGGFEYTPNIYNCGTKTVKGKQVKIQTTDCIKNFLELNDFILIEVADDGNCFYDTLSKYGSRSGNPVLNKPHMELRKKIINTMIDNRNDYRPFFAADIINNNDNDNDNDNDKSLNIEGELRRFLESGQWAGWLGDIVPQIAANILGVNIVIYDLLINEPTNQIDRIIFSGGANGVVTTVNMLRTNGSHFRLLWPKDAPILPKAARHKPKLAPNKTIKANNSLNTRAPTTRRSERLATAKKYSRSEENKILNSILKESEHQKKINNAVRKLQNMQENAELRRAIHESEKQKRKENKYSNILKALNNNMLKLTLEASEKQHKKSTKNNKTKKHNKTNKLSNAFFELNPYFN